MNRLAITNHLTVANRLVVVNRFAAVFSTFRGCFAILALGLFLAAAPPLVRAQSLAEALDTTTSSLVWTTGSTDALETSTIGGPGAWFGQTAVSSPSGGGDAAKSGPIGDNQKSWIETRIQAPASISFDWKVSSESGMDKLTVYANGVKQDEISGEQDWTQKNLFFENTEWITLRWEYAKDISDKVEQDAGWLDHIRYEKTGKWIRADMVGRDGHAMAYDSARQRIVLFGGYYYDGNSNYLGDTWGCCYLVAIAALSS